MNMHSVTKLHYYSIRPYSMWGHDTDRIQTKNKPYCVEEKGTKVPNNQTGQSPKKMQTYAKLFLAVVKTSKLFNTKN